MENKYILVIAIFICIFIVILLFVRFIPILIIKNRAKQNHIDIDMKEALLLIRMNCVSSSFFRQCSLFAANEIDFGIVQLGTHVVSGGNLHAVLQGILYSRKYKISISNVEICALDLAKKDIIGVLKKKLSLHLQ